MIGQLRGLFGAVRSLNFNVDHVRNNPVLQVTAEDLSQCQLMFKEQKKTCQVDEMCL